MSKSFRKSLDEQLNNSEFKDEWECLEPEFQIIREMIDSVQSSYPNGFFDLFGSGADFGLDDAPEDIQAVNDVEDVEL